MKKLFYTLIFIFLLSSCKDTTPRTDYVINGTAKGVYNGIRVYLGELNPRGGFVAMDTAIVMNEVFKFEGSVQEPSLYFLTVNGVNGRYPLMLENSEMQLEIDNSILLNSNLEGSESHDIMTEFNKTVDDNKQKLRLLSDNYSEAQFLKDSVTMKTDLEKIELMNEQITQYPFDYITKNNDNFSVLYIVENLLRQRNTDFEKLTSAFNNLDETLRTSIKGQELQKSFDAISKQLEAEKATAIGAKAPEFSAPNPNGEPLALSDVVSKGKVTIIDFWAAWCGPCRRENPNVVRIYDKYHDKGLEIIGVSLDGRRGQQNPKQAWIEAIEKDGLTWHQVSNLNYFDSIAQSYNVNAIPAMFVLDDEGTIIAKNLRGIMLENKISELLD